VLFRSDQPDQRRGGVVQGEGDGPRLRRERLADGDARRLRAAWQAAKDSVARAAGPLERAALCCINLDDQTPDDNVRAIFAMAERYRQYGA
jgi:hypothetical protein